MRIKNSASRLGRGRSADVAGRVRRDGGLVDRRDPGGRRISVLRQNPQTWGDGRAYPSQRFRWPMFVLPHGCPSPLSNDCTQLQITPRWAIACFKPMYHRLRRRYGGDAERIIDTIANGAVRCGDQPMRGAQHELRRRVGLAVAVLMSHEGVPIAHPTGAQFPRPTHADSVTQPWLRALLTGWL